MPAALYFAYLVGRLDGVRDRDSSFACAFT